MNPIFEKVQQSNYQRIQINANKQPQNLQSEQKVQSTSDSKTLEWAVGLTSAAILIGLGVKKLSPKVSQRAVAQIERKSAEINLPELKKAPMQNVEKPSQTEVINSESITIKPLKEETLERESLISETVKEEKAELKVSPQEPPKAEVAKPEPPTPEPIKSEVAKPEPLTPEPVIAEKTEIAPLVENPVNEEKLEPLVSETVKHENAEAEIAVKELQETIKNYRPHDITVYGFLNGKWLKGNDDAIIDKNVMSKLKRFDTTVLYDKTDNSTQIIMPFGENFYSIRINGIVSEQRALDAARSVNSYGLANPADFSHVIVRSLNKNENNFYTKENIGISYDFHDNGYKVFRGEGAELYASDGRIFLRKVINSDSPWEGTYFCYYNNGQLASTQISVALPSVGNERPVTNNYTISLSGIVSPEKCRKLVEHLNSTVIKNPKDVKEAELPFIQEEVLKFINSN